MATPCPAHRWSVMQPASASSPTVSWGLSAVTPDAAREAHLRALWTRRPNDGAVAHELGRLLARQRRHDEAVRFLNEAIRRLPRSAQAQVDLAQTLRVLGNGEQAGTHFERAAALAPEDTRLRLLVLLNQGTVYDGQGLADETIATFERATHEFPDSADAWAALGFAVAFHRSPEEAAPILGRTLQIDPTRLDVMERFGEVLQDSRRYEDAAIVFEDLLRRDPNRPLVPGRLAHLKMLMADWVNLGPLLSAVESRIADGHLAAEPFGLQGYCASPELLQRAARLYARDRFPDRRGTLQSVDASSAMPRDGRIRLGYVAGEFRNQATSVLLTEVLELHDRQRFDVVCFDNGWDDGSWLRQRIAACCSIVPIRGLPHLAAAQAIRDRGIDVLINLNGYFGLSRSPVFALRPAPVQVNYLGFPGTLGMPYIDYLIADRQVVPLDDRGWYDEQVVTLPDCYQPNDRQRPIASEPRLRTDIGLPEEAFVFCCINNPYKIVPPVFDVWMRLLQRIERAVLLLYAVDEVTRVNLRAEAEARGVDPGRLRFADPMDADRNLRRLQLCDLFLDTWPYNAHTSCSDALWAGLPVLTMSGRTFPSRVAASLLHAVGLPQMVTTTLGDYEALAFRMATSPAELSAVRSRLAAQRLASTLYDTPRYTRHLERAFDTMVQRARAGLPPVAFDVDA